MKTTTRELPALILTKVRPAWRYRVLLFVVLVAGLCSYLVLQINNANNVAPATSAAVSGAPVTPHVDTQVVEQLKALQDNSVSVKALFNEPRENPFD